MTVGLEFAALEAESLEITDGEQCRYREYRERHEERGGLEVLLVEDLREREDDEREDAEDGLLAGLREEGETERPVRFRHSAGAPDDPEQGVYTNSIYQSSENSIMNLGHGRAGHLPDYSFIRYRYLPAWADYNEIVKDNPAEYWQAFCQMVCALQYLRGDREVFETGVYAYDTVKPWEDEIRAILEKRQTDACGDWQALGGKIAGQDIPDLDVEKLQTEYMAAAPEDRDGTFLGAFFLAALAQKSMVTNKIFSSGNLLAGWSVDFSKEGFRGIGDFWKLVEASRKGAES